MAHPLFSSKRQFEPASGGGYDETEKRLSHADKPIDLNEHLIKNRSTTFFLRVHCNAMIDAGIRSGDVVIVDRSLLPHNGAVIIAALQGELFIRRYEYNNGKVWLVPASDQLSPISVEALAGFDVWGVVTYVIRSV